MFYDLKLKKIYSWKFNFYFLDQKLQFPYPYASIKDAQATGEAFSPQKRTLMAFVYRSMSYLIYGPPLPPDRYGHFTNQTGEESAQMLHGPMGGGGGDSRYRKRWNERKKGEEAKERMEEIHTGGQVTGTGIL